MARLISYIEVGHGEIVVVEGQGYHFGANSASLYNFLAEELSRGKEIDRNQGISVYSVEEGKDVPIPFHKLQEAVEALLRATSQAIEQLSRVCAADHV